MNFSLYLFANDLLFAVHFVFILDYGNDVRHKAHLRFSYLSSKWVVKAVETTHNNNNTFDPWPANKRTVPKFCKETSTLKKSEGVAVGSWQRQLRASLKLILLEPRDELSKNSTATILQLFSIWSKLERWKRLMSGCLMCRSEIKKWLFCFSLILQNNNEPFLGWTVTCDKKWIVYDNWWWPVQSVDWEAPKHFPKPNSHPKKVMATVRWSAAGLIHQNCLNFSKTITSETCSANWQDALKTAMPANGTGQQKGPALLYDNAWPHVAQAVLRSFASPTIFTWPLAKWVALFQASWQHFCRENTSITSRMQKTLSKFVGSRSMDFYATGINKHLLSAKT